MSTRLETAWSAALSDLLGPSGIGEDAGIMAAQLDRATAILQRPAILSGTLFETEPAAYYARLEAHAPHLHETADATSVLA